MRPPTMHHAANQACGRVGTPYGPSINTKQGDPKRHRTAYIVQSTGTAKLHGVKCMIDFVLHEQQALNYKTSRWPLIFDT